MKQWLRRAVAAMTAAVLLAVMAGRALGAEEEADADALAHRLQDAREATPDLVAAAAARDLERFRSAYNRFAAALDPVLPAVRAEDPRLAARLVVASDALRGLALGGILSEEDVAREVAVLRGALEEALRAAARSTERVQRFTVAAREYRFEPDELRARPGTRIVVRLENRGRVPHEFRIPELNVIIGPVEPGRSAEGEFIVERPGTYGYECHVDGHYLKGMRGRLVVE